MIPLEKLQKLPRSQKLRKAAILTGEVERRLLTNGQLSPKDAAYIGNIAVLLATDGGFSAPVRNALDISGAGLLAAAGVRPADTQPDYNDIHRSLNTIHHVLLTETGRYQSDWDYREASGSLDPLKRRSFTGMQVYLEDIRAPFNVGSMFRTAESFGAEKIWLSPLCADPRHKRAERTAMGCVDVLPWERLAEDPFTGSGDRGTSNANESSGKNVPAYVKSLLPAIPFFALETGGTPLGEFSFPQKGILIAGSEELGVSPEALAAADASLGRVTIPLYGAKGSLNVSVAFGIVMHAWAVKLAG